MLARLVVTLLIGVCVVAVGCLAERRWAARPPQWQATALNIAYFAAASLFQAVSAPVVAGLAALAVNRLGGGLIVLRSHGLGLAWSVATYVLVMDFGEYLFHRAQHASSILWAMHSLHHSDAALNISTTTRHAWPEFILKSLSIYLLVGLIFKVNITIITAYGVISLYNYFVHANVRVGFGRWAWTVNSPQYHRLHHSGSPDHVNCNFAALLPINDLIFGTYRNPESDQYPASGLASGEYPSTLAQIIIWPLHSLLQTNANKLT